MLRALLAVVAIQEDPESAAPRAPVLYVRTSEDWAPLRSGPVDREIVPLNSRSERLACAALTKDGIGLRLWAGDVPIEGLDWIEVTAVEHALDEFVVAVEGERWILGPATLPPAARLGGESGLDVLPHLARLDGNAIHLDAALWLSPLSGGSGSERWAVLAESLEAPRAPGEAHVLHTPKAWRGRTAALRLGQGPWPRLAVDWIVDAPGRRVDSAQCTPLRLARAAIHGARMSAWEPWRHVGPSWPVLASAEAQGRDVTAALAARDDQHVRASRAELVEAWFQVPASAPEGRTRTLCVSVHGADAWSPATGAPRAARTQSVRPARFVDVARELGIDVVHFEGPDLQLDIRPTMGPGAAWGDVDGDGWVDLFLPQGGGREGCTPPTSRFFRNLEGRRFVDESEARGLALEGAGMGALFYDADGDGDLDLFVANYGRNRFLLNDGAGHFTDASAQVGLDTDRWHAAVSAADYDGDGDLDLYVTSYLHYDPAQMPGDGELGRYQREDPVEMLPFAFPGESKLLLRCEPAAVRATTPALPQPGMRYVDVARELGLDDPGGRGMQAIWWDFDADGDLDLYLANDVSPNRFWRNEGGGELKDVVFSTGLDDPRGSMGLAVGDVDGDLDEDLFVTNWQLESNALYVNNLRHTSTKSRVSTFRDRAVEAGLAQRSVGVTGWGCELADFDLDGDLDLFYANGYTSPDYESTGICVGQPCHYFVNDGAGNFRPALDEAGSDVALPLAARAAVACDYDQDGDLDLVITANNGRVRLLRNEGPRAGRWLGVRLAGRGTNTRAIGARVVVEAGGKRFLRTLRAGTGYLSGNAPELHFGLGNVQSATCTVTWPAGRSSTHTLEALDRFVTLAEPE
ncbi:MAG: CRTAC1 family protein [Planctomycetes bacterium]|nr:CRTAC1 family protein [Planctomycetota bacterium]